MEYKLKAGSQGHVYLPKLIRKAFGDKMKLFPDEIAGAIYREDAKPDEVIASLEVIIQHLKLQQRKEAVAGKNDS
jgi:hypothetical protein